MDMPPTALGPALTAINCHGDGLRVRFTKIADRWHHAIDRIDSEIVERVLDVVEGDPAGAWPASPPFQELSQETLPDGRAVIFLVGRAGTSHWSASVEARLDPPQLVFDIACRHTVRPEYLGSEYATLPTKPATVVSLDGLATIEPRGTQAVSILPKQVSAQLPGTTRWKYAVQRQA